MFDIFFSRAHKGTLRCQSSLNCCIRVPRRIPLALRERILQLSDHGMTCRQISGLLRVAKSTVNDLIRKVRQGQGIADLPRSGRPRGTSKRTDRVIRLWSVADVKLTAAEIARKLYEQRVSKVSTSRSTVTRRIHEFGLFGRIGAKKPSISEKTERPG